MSLKRSCEIKWHCTSEMLQALRNKSVYITYSALQTSMD